MCRQREVKNAPADSSETDIQGPITIDCIAKIGFVMILYFCVRKQKTPLRKIHFGMLKILLLVIICPVPLLPLFLHEKLKVDREEPGVRRRKTAPLRTVLKTDPEANRMLGESIATLTGLGVPISGSISPVVVLSRSHNTLGECCQRGCRANQTDYDFVIVVSRFTLEGSEHLIRNVLFHELIHTVPGGLCHTGQWKKWAKYVSEKTGYRIQRLTDPQYLLLNG